MVRGNAFLVILYVTLKRASRVRPRMHKGMDAAPKARRNPFKTQVLVCPENPLVQEVPRKSVHYAAKNLQDTIFNMDSHL